MRTTEPMTDAGRKTFDRMTRRLTAFDTYAALEAACAAGYAPTLADRDDAAILGASLELDGHRVFYRAHD